MNKLLITIAVLGAALASVAATFAPHAKEGINTEAFYALDMNYADETWYLAGETTIFPCRTVIEDYQGNNNDPVMVGYNAQNERLFIIGQRNQRIILIEDPKVPAGLLTKTNFQLRVPYIDGLVRVEYFERPDLQKDPSITADLREAPVLKDIECEPPAVVPDALELQQVQ